MALAASEDAELANTAKDTLDSQEKSGFQSIFESPGAAPAVLDFFAAREDLSKEMHGAILNNPNTPIETVVNFARNTSKSELLELSRSTSSF